jgi:hypothetical protein
MTTTESSLEVEPLFGGEHVQDAWLDAVGPDASQEKCYFLNVPLTTHGLDRRQPNQNSWAEAEPLFGGEHVQDAWLGAVGPDASQEKCYFVNVPLTTHGLDRRQPNQNSWGATELTYFSSRR